MASKINHAGRLDEAVRTCTLIKKLGYDHHIPDKLKRIVQKCCNRDVSKRYQSCAQLRQALEALRFAKHWRRVEPQLWQSVLPKRTESIRIWPHKNDIMVEYLVNGRRRTTCCKQFQNWAEAKALAEELMRSTTLKG